MNYVTSDMPIYTVLDRYPYLIEPFKKHGLGKFEDREILNKLGPLLKLQTALKHISINSDLFIEMLNNKIKDEQSKNNFTLTDSPERQHELTILALLPCGLKMPFTRTFEFFAEQYNNEKTGTLHYLIEGNMNHELSYYSYIDSITSIAELPDIIISSDINSFFHDQFKKNFLQHNCFININDTNINETFSDIGYSDPEMQFTMLSANILVVVAVKELMGELPGPQTWGQLLSEDYKNTVVMRGQEEFFCNGVLLPFFKLYGMDGIKQMARTVAMGCHPSEMVKMIESKKKNIPPLYIMPYFFAMKIKTQNRVQIYIPEEGAIVSPVQMLVKKSSLDKVKTITDFLCGNKMGQISADAFFPSTNNQVKNTMNNISPLYWLGWDFLKKNNIGKIKKDIENVFKDEFKKTGGIV